MPFRVQPVSARRTASRANHLRNGRPPAHPGLSSASVTRFKWPETALYVLPAQGVIATLRRVSLMVSSRRGFVEAVY